MKDSTKIILTIIGAFTFVLALTIIFVEPVEPQTSNHNPTPTEPIQRVDENERRGFVFREFVNACVATSKDTDMYNYCECSYDYLYDRGGISTIISESEKYANTGELSPLMNEAVNACVSRLLKIN